MGGPNNLEEVEIFLKNMFLDPVILGVKNELLRKFLAYIITKSRLNSAIKNYKQIGSKSPINEITKALCDKINSQNSEFRADFAMNYTPPFAKGVLEKYKEFDEIVLFPLYPHYSIATIGSSIESAVRNLGGKNYKIIEPFYKNSAYNKIIIASIKNALQGREVGEISLIFSAHSLPQKTVDRGDVYEKHIVEHTEILKNLLAKNGLNFKEIILAYQSRLGPIKWLEPNLSDVLENLENKNAIIFPIAFCIDNSETDFELSIEYKKIADRREFGFYKVCRCPNDSDEFAKFITCYAGEA